MKIAIKPKTARLEHPKADLGIAFVVQRLNNVQRRILLEQSAKMFEAVVEAQLAGEDSPVRLEHVAASMGDTLRAAIVDVTDGSGAILAQLRDAFDVEGDEFRFDQETAGQVVDALWNEKLAVPDIEQPCICVTSAPRDKNGRRKADADASCDLCGGTKRRRGLMLLPVWLVGKINDSTTFGPAADIDPKGSQPQ